MKNISKELAKDVIDGAVPMSLRKEKQNGTNCEGFLLNFSTNGKSHRFFMKKTFLQGFTIEYFINDYKLIKSTLKNIVPDTVFIQQPNGLIFSFSAPVIIEFDILDRGNKNYLLFKLITNPRFKKQLTFFIKKVKKLFLEGKYIDLFGSENLVCTNMDELKYLDSFLIFPDKQSLSKLSIEGLNYLEDVLNEVNKKV